LRIFLGCYNVMRLVVNKRLSGNVQCGTHWAGIEQLSYHLSSLWAKRNVYSLPYHFLGPSFFSSDDFYDFRHFSCYWTTYGTACRYAKNANSCMLRSEFFSAATYTTPLFIPLSSAESARLHFATRSGPAAPPLCIIIFQMLLPPMSSYPHQSVKYIHLYSPYKQVAQNNKTQNTEN